MSATMGSVFGVDCTNCGSNADVDVQVMACDTGEVVRDVYACDACEDEIQVGQGFYVSTEEL
jgi:hypothetical protein